MNKYNISGSSLIAECWCPKIYTKELHELVELKNYANVQQINKMVQGEMKILSQNIEEQDLVELNPPTYFRQNGLTEVFQTITDT